MRGEVYCRTLTLPPAATMRTVGTPFIQRFLAFEALGGLVLLAAALLGLAVRNSPLAGWYESMLALPIAVRAGDLQLAKPLTLWVNDGLMAVFFFLVGLEIKREALEGELASARKALLPVLAAFGGMLVPAAIYAVVNHGDPAAIRGWAIPCATDIAFALGVLLLLGSRVPVALKVFLTAVAIIDDLGAIVIIALFYTDNLSLPMIAAAGAGTAVLVLLNRLGVRRIGAYVLVGIVVWTCVLKSGVHATLAGVVTALAVPLAPAPGGAGSLARATEHALHPWVAWGVLPLFAFVNAGVDLSGVTLATLAQGVPLGIAAGLVVGKTVGVFGATWLAVAAGIAERPAGATWFQLFAIAVLCGIGFTMSLFIGTLAFDDLPPSYATQLRLGVLAGSLVAAVLGTLLLRRACAVRNG